MIACSAKTIGHADNPAMATKSSSSLTYSRTASPAKNPELNFQIGRSFTLPVSVAVALDASSVD